MDSRAVLPLFFAVGGITFLFPALAAVLHRLLSLGHSERAIERSRSSLSILIPCYNEQDVIVPTLQSVFSAQEYLLSRMDTKIAVIVALDGPKDQTREVVRPFMQSGQIAVLDQSQNQGKWYTLQELVNNAAGDWCAIVDAGTIWPKDLLIQIYSDMLSQSFVGLAPGYRQLQSRPIDSLIWWVERSIKFIENLAGGPVSLHGACMFFETAHLKQAMKELEPEVWLNDDVVIALKMRERGNIKYYGDRICVSDCGVKVGGKEVIRRKRMLLGNIQWIRLIFPKLLQQKPVVAMLAARRIMRIFWIYNLFVVLGLFLWFLMLPFWVSSLVMAAFLLLLASKKGLRDAAWVSFICPVLIFSSRKSASWS